MCEWTIPGSGSGRGRHLKRGEAPCRECMDAENARQRAARPPGWEGRRKAMLWSCYRLRMPEYLAILDHQGGVCAICRRPFKNSKSTHVDHDHACDHPGKGMLSCPECVRGVLCTRCNSGMAILDDVERLKAAIDYLGRDDVAEIIRESRLWLPAAVERV